MSVDMNMDRIRRWKCVFCGSKLKRKLDAVVSGSGRLIGYSLMCCNCGHIDHFALSPSAIPMYICGERGEVDKINIFCPLTDDELKFCGNKKCPYRPNQEEKPQSSSIGTDATKNNMVVERKYQ